MRCDENTQRQQIQSFITRKLCKFLDGNHKILVTRKVKREKEYQTKLPFNSLVQCKWMERIRFFISLSLVTEALFCGEKSDGNYQAPSTCKGYIACSHGVTTHVECPPGKSFDTATRICQSVDQASCKLDDGRETLISPWKTIVTLKRG